jgi:tetratricopeptide (TPR) repeat protein
MRAMHDGTVRRGVGRCAGGLAARWLRAVVAVALVGGIVPAASAQSIDRVRLLDRGEVTGEIASVSPDAVEITDARSGETKPVPIEMIRDVLIGDEPDVIRNARGMLQRKDGARALAELENLTAQDTTGASDLVLAEVDYVRAAAAAVRAIATGTDLDAAVQGLRGFLTKHARSHHTYEAWELLGDLLGRSGKFAEAAQAYATLEKGPPAYRVRAARAKAALLFEQGQFAEAGREYEAATKVETRPDDQASARQKRAAELGRARCVGRQGQTAEALTMIDAVVKVADPEDADTLAVAYNALGDAYRAGGQDQDALIAFLTVDLVYNGLPESHSEALFNLVQLWEKSGSPERAREARLALEGSYPDSPWTRKLAGAAKAS